MQIKIIGTWEEVVMERRGNYGFAIFWGVVTSVIAIMSLAITAIVVLDKKKKEEERELEDYLETSIN